jgi:predicted DNA-binding protein (MmcQ/YjbR family)
MTARPVKQQPMRLEHLNDVCAALPHTHHVVQWGGSHVWKVGGATGKVFVICSFADDGGLQVTFKCSALSYDLLKEQPGLRPAPYLASRGMTWIQRTDATSMSDVALCDYLRESHRLAAANLSKAVQKALGLLPSADMAKSVSPQRRRSRT